MGKRIGFLTKLRAFSRATGANVAMMFGLSIIPLAIAVGAGLDFANAVMVRNQISDALDAAALAVGANKTSSNVNQLATDTFNANYKGAAAASITPNITNKSATLTGAADVSTTLLSIFGQSTLHVQVTNSAIWGQTKLWVALVLDNTGSMSQTDSTGTSKISALKSASHNLLTTLQGVSANAGDVQVAIIPFAKDVKFPSSMYTSPNDTSWVDWTDWDSTPTAYGFSTPSSSVGPGSSCPYNFGCVKSPGSTSSTSTIPSSGTYSGYICPDSLTSSTPGGSGHAFQGCYTSAAQSTLTTVTSVTQPMKDKQNCSIVSSGPTTCTDKSGWPQTNGSAGQPVQISQTTTTGYTGDSTSSGSPVTSNSSNSDGSTSGNCSKSSGCTWTRTITYDSTVTTTTKTGTNFAHSWLINAHTNWTGCIMDRGPMSIPTGDVPANDYDTNASAPSLTIANSRFPAEINDSCPVATVLPLTFDWTALSSKIDAMTPNGGTNQGIGMAHGMQAMTNVSPYNPGAMPNNTTRYIILLSDGLNTLDRWYGDGSNQSTPVDTREKAACDNAKAQGIVIYTVFVDLGGTQGSSSALQYCASDSSKYYDLTTSGAIVTTFNQIAQQITSLHLAS